MIVKLANVKPADSQIELGDCISSPNSISSASTLFYSPCHISTGSFNQTYISLLLVVIR